MSLLLKPWCTMIERGDNTHPAVVPSEKSDTSGVHTSGIGQLQANPPVAGPRHSPGKATQMVVTTMVSNDLVIGEDKMLGPSCQRYN